MPYIIIIPLPYYLHHCLPFIPWWISAAVTTSVTTDGGGGAGIYQVKRNMDYDSKINGMSPRRDAPPNRRWHCQKFEGRWQ